MKHCQCCGWEGDPPESTCPACGEASWSEMAPPAPSEEPSRKPREVKAK